MSQVLLLKSRSRRIKALAAASAASLLLVGTSAFAQIDTTATVAEISAASAAVIAIGGAVLGVLATILAFKMAKRLM